MTALKLEYTGMDCMSGDLYKDEEGTYFAKFRDDSINDFIYIGKDPEQDPWDNIRNMERFKDIEVITVGDENLPNGQERFNYMMLSRLLSDCKYYLGNGNRYEGHLWAKTVKEQIEEMKRIWGQFAENKKPEWLTWEDILNYEKEMIK